MMRKTMCLAAALLLCGAAAESAKADPEPHYKLAANHKEGPWVRVLCDAFEENTESCQNAALYYLDKARESIGLPAYRLPANFLRLDWDRQLLILTNLDREAAGQTPVTGTLEQIDEAVRGDQERGDTAPAFNGGYTYDSTTKAQDPLDAYFRWMYGSADDRCLPRVPCWLDRLNVLYNFSDLGLRGWPPGASTPPGYTLALGAAQGEGAGRRTKAHPQPPFYEGLMLVATTDPVGPYSYTWKQAVRAGAGTHVYKPATPHCPHDGKPCSVLAPHRPTGETVRWRKTRFGDWDAVVSWRNPSKYRQFYNVCYYGTHCYSTVHTRLELGPFRHGRVSFTVQSINRSGQMSSRARVTVHVPGKKG